MRRSADAGGGEARAVEQTAAIDHGARAGQLVGPERHVGRVVGLQDGARRVAPVPGLEAERAQLGVVVERVGRQRLGAARGEGVAQRRRRR